MRADLVEVLDALKTILVPGLTYEVRVPKAGKLGTIAGYFNDIELLARAAMGLDGRHPGIYTLLNPCREDLLARANNRIKPYMKDLTGDSEIICRRWLPCDFDPKRPSGISSTDDEHERAIAAAYETRNVLRAIGWPDPIVADSGNGAHLLYRIDAPNTPETSDLIKQLIAGVAARCSTDEVLIDGCVYNPARIWKLYGTLSCKGDSILSRPHRRARLLEVPSRLEPLALNQEG
jgi:hypothetical protein